MHQHGYTAIEAGRALKEMVGHFIDAAKEGNAPVIVSLTDPKVGIDVNVTDEVRTI
jgi:hypothetical protein